MRHYKIIITDIALEDMESIYDYISNELLAPDAAMGQYNRIADAIERLDHFPERVKVVDSEPEKSWGLRRLNVDNYAIFYLIEKNSIIVTNVLYGASDIENKLR